MIFNFEQDHAEIYTKLDNLIEYKYLREFYLRFNSRGIYINHVIDKTSYKSIENQLNSNITLKTLACNSILNSNNDLFIKASIDSVPTCLYPVFFKSALYTINDFAVHLLIKNWPYESLELAEYFQEAYSSLLFYYKTDINSFTEKLAPEILKWLVITSKYTKLVTQLFLKNQYLETYKLRRLDITGLPVSNRLLRKILDKYYYSIFGEYVTYEKESSESSDSNDRIESYSDDNSECDTDSDFDEISPSSSESDFDFKEFIHKCRSRFSEGFKRKLSDDQSGSSTSFEKYEIKLDAILSNLGLLIYYLKIVKGRLENKDYDGMEVIVNKLDLTVHNEKFCLIDQFYDLEALKITGLGIFFNTKQTETAYTFNLIKKFKNIQDLNLSAFGLEGSLHSILDTTNLQTLSSSLNNLKHLKRLRLSIPGLKNKLDVILQNLHQPLEYLNLTSCGLNEYDLSALSESKHVCTINNLVLSNNDLNTQIVGLINILNKMRPNLQVLDLGCNSFSFDSYFRLVNEGIQKLENLKMLVTLDVFTFDNYVKLIERLSILNKFVSWRINYSSDYYEKSVKIKNKCKFRKFRADYMSSLEKRFGMYCENKRVKITINDPDLNFILNELF